jgi:hydrogenase expression/formation protein HypE
MNERITIHHGSGGSRMHELIDRIFIRHFSNAALNERTDAAILRDPGGRLAFTTDSYVVDPLFFPGGDIGKLAVCGTLNDLAVSYARPIALCASFILEEGLPLSMLEKIVKSMASEAKKAGVPIVTGDTKVVHKGKCDKIFITTSGIGVLKTTGSGSSGPSPLRPGDRIILSGSLGDHAITILLAREEFSFRAKIRSDCASLYPVISTVTAQSKRIRMMRDVTRGGLSSVLNEIAGGHHVGIEINEKKIPVKKEVKAVCELLGFDPLNLANEGKFVVVAGKEDAERLTEVIRTFPGGRSAAVIGTVIAGHPGKVVMSTVSGGQRVVEMVSGEQFPRIC